MKIEAKTRYGAFDVPGWSAPWFFVSAVLLAWSWFNPYVYLPWTDFAKDSYIALCFVIVSGFWFWRCRAQPFSVPIAAWACVLLIGTVATQFTLGYFAYGEHAIWAIATLAACAWICVLSAHLSRSDTGRALTALLCMAVILAGVLNLGVAVAQRFRWMPYDDINLPGLLMAAARDPLRPGGNFGQRNIFASFMLWALLASGWMHAQRHLGRMMLIALSVLFCFGAALTQSRMVAVSMTVLLLLSWLGARRFPAVGRGALRRWAIGCVAVYALSTGALILQAYWMDGDALRSGVLSDPVRKIIYATYFEASMLKPWLGWGMTHFAEVQWTVWPMGTGHGVLYVHAHNIVLDMALWVGWPLTLLLGCILGWRAWQRMNEIDDMPSWCAFATLAVLFTHACLELPHMMAFFFLPAAWWVGVLSGRSDGKHTESRALALFRKASIRGIWGFAASMSLAVYLAVMFWEYHRIEPEFWRIRFENAKIGKPQPPDLPSTWLLTPLADRITLQATACTPGMSEAQLIQLERSTRGFPSLPSIYLTACAYGLSGQAEKAKIWMRRLNRIASAEQVAHYAKEWEKRRVQSPDVSTQAWLPLLSASTQTKELPASQR